jgi:hypothetical protein
MAYELEPYPSKIQDGMLHMSLGTDSKDVSARLRRLIIRRVADDNPGSMAGIFRAARMCFELERDMAVSGATLEDVALLYEMVLDEVTERLFKTLNTYKSRVTASSVDPATAHAAAMSVMSVMTS